MHTGDDRKSKEKADKVNAKNIHLFEELNRSVKEIAQNTKIITKQNSDVQKKAGRGKGKGVYGSGSKAKKTKNIKNAPNEDMGKRPEVPWHIEAMNAAMDLWWKGFVAVGIGKALLGLGSAFIGKPLSMIKNMSKSLVDSMKNKHNKLGTGGAAKKMKEKAKHFKSMSPKNFEKRYGKGEYEAYKADPTRQERDYKSKRKAKYDGMKKNKPGMLTKLAKGMVALPVIGKGIGIVGSIAFSAVSIAGIVLGALGYGVLKGAGYDNKEIVEGIGAKFRMAVNFVTKLGTQANDFLESINLTYLKSGQVI